MSGVGSWVRRLHPTAPIEHLVPACTTETWNTTVAAIGVGAAAWVVELSDELAPLALDPELGPARREAAVAEVRPTTQAVVMLALIALDQDLPVPTTIPPETSLQLARAVRRRIELSAILAYQRNSHALLSDVLIAECRRLVPPEDQSNALSRLSHFLVDHVSTFGLACAAAYVAEEHAWMASVDGSRGELVRRLLRGETLEVDPGTALRYEISNRTHLGLVLRRAPGEDHSTLEPLDRAASSILTRAGAARPHLVVPVDDHEVWAWGAFVDPADAAPRAVGEAPDTLIAVGRLASGLEGWRSTHEAASTAADVALLTPTARPRGRTVFFEDVRLAALLMKDPEGAESFVRDELGALGGPRESVLRETVRVYLECNCSPASAAARLNVVKNTVVYRIRRAEDLLGRSVKENQGMLWTALHLAHTIDLSERSHVH